MNSLIWNVPDVVLGGTINKEYIWKLEDLKRIKKNGLKNMMEKLIIILHPKIPYSGIKL